MCIMIVLLVYVVSGGMCYAFEGIENDDYPEYDIHETYDNADMLYQSYMIEFYDWMNHIEKDFIFNDRVFKGRVYSDRVNELIMRSEEQYPTGLFMNKGINIDICVNEILVDAFGGYIVFTLKNDIYQLKPMDCLYVYSPYYAPAEYYKLPTVFLNCQHIVFTDSEGEQHRFSISG